MFQRERESACLFNRHSLNFRSEFSTDIEQEKGSVQRERGRESACLFNRHSLNFRSEFSMDIEQEEGSVQSTP